MDGMSVGGAGEGLGLGGDGEASGLVLRELIVGGRSGGGGTFGDLST
jgi:hypothetical protein